MEGSEADSSRPEHAEADGIYAATVTIGEEEFRAAAFADPSRKVLEAHILDFFLDIYGQEITIELHKKMRDTEDFATDAELKIAISEDLNAVRQYFTQEQPKE